MDNMDVKVGRSKPFSHYGETDNGGVGTEWCVAVGTRGTFV